MNHVFIRTARTELKFPLPYISKEIVKDAISDRETIQFMSAVPTMDYTLEHAKMFLDFLNYTKDSETDLELGVFDIKTNNFIGMCTLENIDKKHSVCALGYWLTKSHIGRGYMTECANALIHYAKDELKMKYINAYVITEHRKSISLLERLGFIKKDLLIDDTENKGVTVDRYWYQLKL